MVPSLPRFETMPCAPTLPRSNLLESWLELWSSTVFEAVEEIVSALSTPPRPADLPRFYRLLADRTPPSWATPHGLVLETPVARLRDFSTRKRSKLIPTLVLPPQAGHDSCIVDFSPQQSQMRTILASGHERALALDWKPASRETADASIEDYLDAIDLAVDHVGGRVNLIGDCQGGWLATIYAALAPERINTLTLAGAPIDFHAGEPVIGEVLRHLAPGGNLSFYQTLVALDGGVLRGEHMLAGFIMIKPLDEFRRQLELLRHLDDEAHVARYVEFENWFKHAQDIPGRFYLWIIRHLFRDNELVSGALMIGERRVDPRAIDVPLNLLAGAIDHITPPDQVFAAANVVATPPELVRRETTAGGHLGLFMGHEALRDHWPKILAATLEHSR